MSNAVQTLLSNVNEQLSNEVEPYKNYRVELPELEISMPSLLIRNQVTNLRVQIPFTHEDTSTLYPVSVITEVQTDIIIKKIKEVADAFALKFQS